MTTIQIPRTAKGVVAEIAEDTGWLTDRQWALAAKLAAVVRLPGRPGPSGDNGEPRYLTANKFAALGIKGLRDDKTVRLYVQRWLDANDGEYPELGKKVKLPTIDWPPRDDWGSGFDSDAGAAKTIERIIEKHGPQVIARAVAKPEVADAVIRDSDATLATIRAMNRQQAARPEPRKPQGGGISDVLMKLLQQLGAMAYAHDGERLHKNLVARDQDKLPWKPGEREAIKTKVDEGVHYGQLCQELIAGLSDDDLAKLLGA